MRHQQQRAAKAQPTEVAAERAPADATRTAHLQRLNAVEQVAAGVLSRIRRIVEENPEAVVNKQGTMFPRERDDKQTYFLEKIARSQQALDEIARLLETRSQGAALQEQIREELKVFFVLIESFRPERILESGWDPGEGVREAIREKFQWLVLDVINMRERLK